MEAQIHPQPEVVVYTTSWCPYCRRAEALLERKAIRYREIDVDADPAGRREMILRTGGRRTVPQIFIGDRLIGGCDELHALEAAGELDRMLGRTAGLRSELASSGAAPGLFARLRRSIASRAL
jgi:glutaredoxin 3